jgi:nucleotide-binding universal stress UspA family protein
MAVKRRRRKHELRVIVGVDGSPPSVRALSWACRLGETCGDSVRAVCAWSLGASGEDWMVQPEVSAEGQRLAEQVLRESVDRVRSDYPAVKVETAVVEGPPARVLVDMSADADLLVVGSRGRGGFSGLLLGSVSQQCVHHAHCPVTVVR